MPRKARIIVEGMPHHIIQRGTRKQRVFFRQHDRTRYLSILRCLTRKYQVDVWAYCLMDNHVHLVVVPKTKEGLAKAMGQTHKTYALLINQREKWRGHLWEGRYKSFVMSESYVYKAVRYVENNPVRAGLVNHAEDYTWSSARAHVYKIKDPLLSKCYLLYEIRDWVKYLRDVNVRETEGLRKQIKTELPWGEDEFVRRLEKRLDRVLKAMKRGRRFTYDAVKISN